MKATVREYADDTVDAAVVLQSYKHSLVGEI
jgi:hypothetical protein